MMSHPTTGYLWPRGGYIHMHVHTQRHTQIDRHRHRHTQTHTQTLTHTHTHTQTHTQTHTHTLTHTNFMDKSNFKTSGVCCQRLVRAYFNYIICAMTRNISYKNK